MTDEEIKDKVANLVRIWVDYPRVIGRPRPSVQAVITEIAKVLEQAQLLDTIEMRRARALSALAEQDANLL